MRAYSTPIKIPGAVQVALFVMVGFLISFLGYQEIKDAPLLLTSTILGAYLIIKLLLKFRTGELISPVALYSGLFLLHFSIPGIITSLGFVPFAYRPNMEYAFQAQVIIIFSFFAFELGARLSIVKMGPPKLRQVLPVWGESRVLLVIVALLVIGYAARLFFISEGLYFQQTRTSTGGLGALYSTLRQAERAPLLSLYITAIFYYSYALKFRNSYSRVVFEKRSWFYILLTLVIMEVAYWVPSGRKTDLMFAIMIPLIIRYFYIPKLPSLKVIILFIVFVVAYFQVNHMYRFYISVAQHANIPVTETIMSAIDDIGEKRYSYFESDSGSNYILKRMNLLESVSSSIRLVETDAWPISYGEQYLWLGTILIPRILWDNKPGFHYGNEFGYKAGFIDISNENTSISVTFIGEAYLNFSWVAPLVMVGFGWFFTWLYVSGKRSGSINWFLLYILSLPILLYPGGTFALYFGGLVKTWLLAALLIHFMARGRLVLPGIYGNGGMGKDLYCSQDQFNKK